MANPTYQSAELPSTRAQGKPRPKQFPFVESPATVLLQPVYMGKTATWWSFDEILVGGIKVNSYEGFREGDFARIAYLPTPIPRSWGEREFGVVVEYEADENAAFLLRLHYGCGDPSELHRGETPLLDGKTGGKRRICFQLDESKLHRSELLRCTLEVQRQRPEEVLIYGAWLEIGVD